MAKKVGVLGHLKALWYMLVKPTTCKLQRNGDDIAITKTKYPTYREVIRNKKPVYLFDGFVPSGVTAIIPGERIGLVIGKDTRFEPDGSVGLVAKGKYKQYEWLIRFDQSTGELYAETNCEFLIVITAIKPDKKEYT